MHHRKNIGAFLVKLATYWFSLRSFESDRFYEKLGIKFFKKYLYDWGFGTQTSMEAFWCFR